MSGINNAFTLNINTLQNKSKILCTESGNSKNKETRINTVTLSHTIVPSNFKDYSPETRSLIL